MGMDGAGKDPTRTADQYAGGPATDRRASVIHWMRPGVPWPSQHSLEHSQGAILRKVKKVGDSLPSRVSWFDALARTD